MTVHRILGLALLTVALPTIAFAQKTTYDFDKSAVFSQYKTYAMKDGTKAGQPLVDQRFVAAIEMRRARLLIGASAKVPDVLVRLLPDPGEPAVVANTDSFFSRRVAWHRGQAGIMSPRTSFSNSCPQPLQAYS